LFINELWDLVLIHDADVSRGTEGCDLSCCLFVCIGTVTQGSIDCFADYCTPDTSAY